MPEPIRWGAGCEAQFLEWSTTELRRSVSQRSTLERVWKDQLEQYRAPVATEKKSHPWEGASNRTLPLTGMNADPLIARFLTSLHAPANLLTLQALNERWVEVAKPLQDYLQWLDVTTLNMFDVNYRAMLEFVKLGTAIYKVGWQFERRRARKYGPNGRLQTTVDFLSRPFVDHVSLVDFLIPPEAYAIQADQQGGAAWVAERIWLRKDQLRARAKGQEPFLPDYRPEAVALVEKFEESRAGSGGGVEEKRYSLDQYEPFNLLRIELFEVHARYDTTGEGTVDDVVAVLHLPSRSLLRAVLNPYRHGLRPYECARYFRGDGFYGIGVCEQSEMFQDALTELINYQFDNVLLANAKVIAVRAGANIVPSEPWYPGKQLVLDDPTKDVFPFTLGEVYPSLNVLGSIFQNWGERRVGVNDLTLGNPTQMPSRTPATTTLSLLQEGSRRFDLSLKELRTGCLDRVGLRLLQNLQQFLSEPVTNPAAEQQLQIAVMALGEPEGTWVRRVLELPLEEIEQGLGVSVTATSGTANKEVQSQRMLALLQLQTQMGQQYLQLASVLANPQVQQAMPFLVETAAQVYRGFTELHKRVLEQYDIRNPEDIVVAAASLSPAGPAVGGGGPSAGPDFGAGGGAAGPADLAALAGLSGGGAGAL